MSKRMSKSQGKELPSSALAYAGPIRFPENAQGAQLDTEVLQQITSFSVTNVAASNGQAISSDPTGATDWSSFAAIWGEYRVLGMEVEHVPFYDSSLYPAGVTFASGGPVYTAVDHTNAAAAPTSIADIVGYSSLQGTPFSKKFKRTVKASAPEEMQFGTTASAPPSTYSVVTYINTGTQVATTQLGQLIVRRRVQFRTRK